MIQTSIRSQNDELTEAGCCVHVVKLLLLPKSVQKQWCDYAVLLHCRHHTRTSHSFSATDQADHKNKELLLFVVCAWSAPAPSRTSFRNVRIFLIVKSYALTINQSISVFGFLISIYNLNKLLPSNILYSNMQEMSWTQSFPNVKN